MHLIRTNAFIFAEIRSLYRDYTADIGFVSPCRFPAFPVQLDIFTDAHHNEINLNEKCRGIQHRRMPMRRG